MSPRSCRTAALFGLLAASVVAVPQFVTTADAVGSPSSYTVPSGVEVLEMVLVGGRGGSSTFYPGGLGCRVTTPVGVAAGDSVTWLLGGDGGATTATANVTTGGQGGSGARPGGNGGNLRNNSNGNGFPGAGGGAASAAFHNGVEVVVAAGGGGASGLTGGGWGCNPDGSGSGGAGSLPVAEGGSSPLTGGAGGLGNWGSATPNPGLAGNSATGTPAGRGGDGADSCLGLPNCNPANSGGYAGGGGGGGLSGGGGGAGAKQVSNGGSGTGGVGLSGVTGSATMPGLAAARYEAPAYYPASVASHLAVNAVEVTTNQLPPATVGTAYTASLVATFGEVFTTSSSAGSPVGAVTWALATGSATLPGGLTLATTGAITGTPTSTGTFPVTFAASVLDGSQLLRARSVVTLALVVGAPPVSPAQGLVATPVNPPTTTPPSTVAPATSTPGATPSTTTSPSTTPAPVPNTTGGVTEMEPGAAVVTEDGTNVSVALLVENQETLVLKSEDFELRLKGNCSTGCTISESPEGRATIELERFGTANVSGFGFLPGSVVHVWIFSDPRYLGAIDVAADGTYAATFPLEGIEPGLHTLQANGFSFDNVPRSANLGIVVVDQAAPAPASGQLPATGSGDSTVMWGAGLLALGALLLGRARRRTATA